MSDVKICSTTGLALVRAPSSPIFRIAKSSFGPLNPQVRDVGSDRAAWSRFDVGAHRTIYGGQPMQAAYAESIAWARNGLPEIAQTELFSELDSDEEPYLYRAVYREWEELGLMVPGFVPAGWRFDRLMHRITLDQDSWFIDIEHSASVAVLRTSLADVWDSLEIDDFTTAHLRGADREVTTNVAEWVWHRVLEDGSRPGGLQFCSKHGSDWKCWAAWLRQTDDDLPEPTTADDGTAIDAPTQNDEYKEILDLFSLGAF